MRPLTEAPGNARTRDPETLLEEFDLLWRNGSPVRIETLLAKVAGAVRAKLLVELIKIELEYRWRKPGGYRPMLEDYVVRFPELGPPGRLPADLIGEEYRVRQRWGDRPGHQEYGVRFSGHSLGLEQLLRRIDSDLTAEFQRTDRVQSHPETIRSIPWAEPVQPLNTPAELIEFFGQHQLLSPQQLADLNVQVSLPTLARELARRGWLTLYQLNHLLSGRGPQLLLGPYILMDELGAGCSGWVFKARHRHLNRLVALKVLRQDLLADLTGLRRFYREIQLLSRLSHPHVIHAYDGGPIGSTHVLVLEYASGIDLNRLVKRSGPLPLERACEYIRQTALGLQYIHDCGLVHRDIAPSNLLVTPAPGTPAGQDGQIKILDLGMARLRNGAGGFAPGARHCGGSSAWLAGVGAVVVGGTPDYLAPEQALDFHKVDIRADLYSLGCTLYFLLAGRPPFPGGNLTQKLLRHQNDSPPDVRSQRPDVPPWLVFILDKMLAKAPGGRFDQPKEIADRLAHGLGQSAGHSVSPVQPAESLPTIAGEPFAFLWEAPRRQRPSWLIWLAALPLLALAATLAVMVWQSNPDRQAKEGPIRFTHQTHPGKGHEARALDFASGFAPNKDLILNGSAILDGQSLRLTGKEPNQAGSAFSIHKIRIDHFETRFRFRLQHADADGFTFTIQGNGPGALGPSGGGLGYGPHLAAEKGGIPRSVAIKFDLYDNEGEGTSSTGLYTNGAAPTVAQSIDLHAWNIDLHSGHEFAVAMIYDGQHLKVTITDLQTRASASQDYFIDIPRLIGGPEGHVGFTGGTGGGTAIQQILSWTYQPK